MIEEAPPRHQKSEKPVKVLGHVFAADVLEHPDRGNGIKCLTMNVPVILQANLYIRKGSGLEGPRTGEYCLRGAEGDRHCFCAVSLYGV